MIPVVMCFMLVISSQLIGTITGQLGDSEGSADSNPDGQRHENAHGLVISAGRNV